MNRLIVATLVLVGSLGMGGLAQAAPIVPTNFDLWLSAGSAGAPTGAVSSDLFDTFAPPPATIGTLLNTMYYNPATFLYTYAHTVTPSINNIDRFGTDFKVGGFTGVAGWSFSQAGAAGGAGAGAFSIEETADGRIHWTTLFGGGNGWDAPEPITFFFVSVLPPLRTGLYRLEDGEIGLASSFAPTPEPGSLALMAAGLVGLYGLARRRLSGLS